MAGEQGNKLKLQACLLSTITHTPRCLRIRPFIHSLAVGHQANAEVCRELPDMWTYMETIPLQLPSPPPAFPKEFVS